MQRSTIDESQSLRAPALPQLPPVFAIRPVGLLAHTGLPVQCLNNCASKLAHLLSRCPGLSQ